MLSSPVKAERVWYEFRRHLRAPPFVLSVLWFVAVQVTVVSFALSKIYSDWTLVYTLGLASATAIAGTDLALWVQSYYSWLSQDRQLQTTWKREFAVELVRDLYGPVYDELLKNMDRVPAQFSDFKWDAGSRFRMNYLSLLVPEPVLRSGETLRIAALDYNRDMDRTLGVMQQEVHNVTDKYLRNDGRDSDFVQGVLRQLSGAEARAILGAKADEFGEHYARFLRVVEEAWSHSRLGDIMEFDHLLREAILGDARAKSLIEKRDKILRLAGEMVDLLRPLIKEPYERGLDFKTAEDDTG